MQLQARFVTMAEARPAATAVVMGGDRLTYGELHAASLRFAAALAAAGCTPGDRVAILMEKSMGAVTAVLGTLAAGCAYVPLDPSSPPARLDMMLAACRPTALVGDFTTAPRIGQLQPRWAVSIMHELDADFERPPEPPPTSLPAGRPADWAYVMFTSGSTGQPKGVPITHSSASHFVDWAVEHFGMSPADRVPSHAPLYFDLSILDVFATLSSGGELHLVPPHASLVPATLAGFIAQRELTQWLSVPSVLTYLAKHDAIPATGLSHLRRVMCCGEVLPTATVMHWMDRVPTATFTNLYGPVEATCASSFHTVTERPADPAVPVPIGRPIPGEELLVLDAELRPTEPGVIGDLYIAGAGLSPGYLGDRERTQQAFVRHAGRVIYRTGDLASVDGDGVHHFHGRTDTQVKSRGYRIELGEIEAALSSLDYLLEAVVLPTDDPHFAGVAITCAFAPRAGESVTPARIRRDLGRIVPPYMLPTAWRSYATLPKNANGKVDRVRLLGEVAGAPPA